MFGSGRGRVQILFYFLFATIIAIVVKPSSSSPSTVVEFSTDSTSTNATVDSMKVLIPMCAKSDKVIGYNESQEFCKCDPNVVSCDFSNFKSEKVSVYLFSQ